MKYVGFTAGILSLLMLSACSFNQQPAPTIQPVIQPDSQASSQLEWLTSNTVYSTLTGIKYPKGFYIKPSTDSDFLRFDIDSYPGKMVLGNSGVGCEEADACTEEGLEIAVTVLDSQAASTEVVNPEFLQPTQYPSIKGVDIKAYGDAKEKTADGVFFLPKQQYYFYGKNTVYEIQVWENNYKGPGSVDEIVQGVLASLHEDAGLASSSQQSDGLSQEVSPAGFSVYVDQQKHKYVLDEKGTVVADLPIVIPADGEIDVKIFKETPHNVYIRSCGTGIGGYILYDICQGDLYAFSRDKHQLKTLTMGGLTAMDISADETMIAWGKIGSSNNKPVNQIIITNMDPRMVETINIDSKYMQFGDAKFSPAGSKIAYAVAVGNPDQESGAVIVYDLKKHTSKTIDTVTTNNSFEVDGWQGNSTVVYHQAGNGLKSVKKI